MAIIMIRNFAHPVNSQKVMLRYEAGVLEWETGLEPVTACLGDIAVSRLCVWLFLSLKTLL
jgi:hypothetical protein